MAWVETWTVVGKLPSRQYRIALEATSSIPRVDSKSPIDDLDVGENISILGSQQVDKVIAGRSSPGESFGGTGSTAKSTGIASGEVTEHHCQKGVSGD